MRIAKLKREHDVDRFDCGVEPLNLFLHRFALQGQQAGASQSYVGLDGAEVVGYYTIAMGEVAFDDAPTRLAKGMPRHPIPVMVLARLAVAASRRGQRLGEGLVKDAMARTLEVGEIVGVRAMIVHAKNEAASAFYQRLNFQAFESSPLTLAMLLKDIRAWLNLKPRA